MIEKTNLTECYFKWAEAKARQAKANFDVREAHEELLNHILKHHWGEFMKIDYIKLKKAMEKVRR